LTALATPILSASSALELKEDDECEAFLHTHTHTHTLLKGTKGRRMVNDHL